MLLDANENAFGPSLAVTDHGHQVNGNGVSVGVDLLGLNRYPDP